MYYLKSRYYDPEICRWINADDASNLGANSDFASLNLFAYCGNNPVSRKDESGELWEIIAIGAVVGAVIGGVSAGMKGGNIGDIVLSTMEGAVTGGLCAAGNGGIIAGAAIHGIYIGATSEGNETTRLMKGAAAFVSTLFWGGFGNFVTKGLTGFYSLLGNILFDFNFGVAAEATNYVIQSSIDVKNDFIGSMFIKPSSIKGKSSPFYKQYFQNEVFAV